ncbi:hypothetical protein C9439_00220 [archaeon SCG-AAA382B04]|nr:hypothetical protein C9439_00220 [archaeon SCG-AAA382B04]
MVVINPGEVIVLLFYISISILLYLRWQTIREIGSLNFLIIGYVFLFFEHLLTVLEGFFSFLNYLEHLSLAIAVLILTYWLYLFIGGKNE